MMSDYEKLSSVFAYEPETGIVRWKIRTKGYAGLILPGDEAGTVSRDGRPGYARRQIKYQGRFYRAHRLIWLLMTKEWPPKGFDVDHKDRNALNNRWDNLRLATRTVNNHNAVPRKDNTTGHRGVSPTKRGRWDARIHVGGRTVVLGQFKRMDDAIAARRQAEVDYLGAVQ